MWNPGRWADTNKTSGAYSELVDRLATYHKIAEIYSRDSRATANEKLNARGMNGPISNFKTGDRVVFYVPKPCRRKRMET